mmetsp:Transcript_52056/g.156207  ORF Transcript_52056/g.156207 Transcript_52056/m.156207 type:complete len:134 (-) Transcript_52056:134-535(-)|eukprot:CAMPEP_0113553184 /NCGR_PEP_ID=MMETSP0015_2-20120614/15472_1 /TAXON_ID=2838 /ORGANISM="Odontella" /LENGTH=133 /DNA_ID=CAMNT_0000454225 /DNA_START=293 /DNA_END=694 /DNA_ORIENTATION=- /assembly_acc=CAM_ASM_000160
MSQQESAPLDENAVLQRYRELQSECTQLVRKVAELEVDRNEHVLVEKTLAPLDSSRRAFRLVGGVLVERTVGEVLPSVETNRKNLDELIGTLQGRLDAKQKETAEWKAKYNIRTAEEAQAIQREQMRSAQATS